MANLLEGIGQAYAQDYRNVRKERKEAERKARRDQLLYSTILAPLGQSLAEGVTEFINQPYVSKHEDFVGRESRRYRKQYGDYIGLKKRLDNLDSQASAAHVFLYNQSNSDTELTREVVREFGKNWEANQDARAYYDESKSKSLAAYKQQVDELREAVAKGASLEMTPDEYRAKLEKTSPYAKTAVGAGFRAIGRMIGIGNTKPLDEREMEALKAANPTIYEFISGRSRAEFQRDYNAARDLTASAGRPEFTEAQESLRKSVARERQNNFDYSQLITNGKLGDIDYDQGFVKWADENNYLTSNNATSFVPGNANYQEALKGYKNNEAFKDWRDSGRSVTFNAASEDIDGSEDRANDIKTVIRPSDLTPTNFQPLSSEIENYIKTGEVSEAIANYISAHGRKISSNVLNRDNFSMALSNTTVEGNVAAYVDKARAAAKARGIDLTGANIQSFQKQALLRIEATTKASLIRYVTNSKDVISQEELGSYILPAMLQVTEHFTKNNADLSSFELRSDVMIDMAERNPPRLSNILSPEVEDESEPGETPRVRKLAERAMGFFPVGGIPKGGTSEEKDIEKPEDSSPADIDPDDYFPGPLPSPSLLANQKEQPEVVLTPDEDIERLEVSEIQEIISEVSGLFGDSEKADQFLNAVALNESNYGQDTGTYNISRSKNKRGSLGIFQIDEVAFTEVMDRLVGAKPAPRSLWKHKDTITNFIQKYSDVPLEDITYENLQDDRINTLFARLYIMTKVEPLPDYEDMGRYWKKYYNTSAGKGNANKFMDRVDTFKLKKASL